MLEHSLAQSMFSFSAGTGQAMTGPTLLGSLSCRVNRRSCQWMKEERTVAAVVPAIGMDWATSPMPQPDEFEMEVNRPFMFMIEDSKTGAILFMGLVFEPKGE